MESSTPPPKILHLSYRPSPSQSEHKWLNVNVVVEVFDQHDIARCESLSSEWIRSTLYEVEDTEKIHLHFLNTEFKFKSDETMGGLSVLTETYTDPEYDISDKIRRGWTYNDMILTKAKKPNIYFLRDFVEDNEVTRAALKMLKDIKEDGENACNSSTSRFVLFSCISRCLKTLSTFWD